MNANASFVHCQNMCGRSWKLIFAVVFTALEIIAAVLDPIQIARYLKQTSMPAAPPARAGVKMRVANDEWC
jgi:hypothetical protein